MAASKFHFTKARLDALPIPDKRTYYRDTGERTLGLYVTPAGAKSHFATFTVAGRTKRVPIGKHPVLAAPVARRKAADVAAEAARTGVSPAEAKRATKAAEITARQVLEAYIASRDLRPRSEQSYREALEAAFGAHMDRPLASITEKVVVDCHAKRGETSKAQAELACRALSALFSFAAEEYRRSDGASLFAANPVRILSDTRRHFRIARRKRIISEPDLPAWWAAVHDLPPVARDFMVFVALTGTRREETRQLTWDRIDLRSQTFKLIDTKNCEDVTLPLPRYVTGLLRARKQTTGLVFPQAAQPNPLHPQRIVQQVCTATGIKFSTHDSRRGYITIAEAMDISVYTIKALVNHQIKGDVTAGYVVQTPERLRAASKRIEDKLLRLAREHSGNVIDLPLAR